MMVVAKQRQREYGVDSRGWEGVELRDWRRDDVVGVLMELEKVCRQGAVSDHGLPRSQE